MGNPGSNDKINENNQPTNQPTNQRATVHLKNLEWFDCQAPEFRTSCQKPWRTCWAQQLENSPWSFLQTEITLDLAKGGLIHCTIWCATREKGLSDACVKRRFKLACARGTSWSEITLSFFMYLFCLQQIYSSTKSNGVVKCRLGSACADSAGWSEMTLYANVWKSLFAFCKPYEASRHTIM